MNPAFTPPPDYARREVAATKVCIGCGCSELNPCTEGYGNTCSWVPCDEGPLCSFCAEIAFAMAARDAGKEDSDHQPLVQLASDAQCDAFLRARRAGA